MFRAYRQWSPYPDNDPDACAAVDGAVLRAGRRTGGVPSTPRTRHVWRSGGGTSTGSGSTAGPPTTRSWSRPSPTSTPTRTACRQTPCSRRRGGGSGRWTCRTGGCPAGRCRDDPLLRRASARSCVPHGAAGRRCRGAPGSQPAVPGAAAADVRSDRGVAAVSPTPRHQTHFAYTMAASSNGNGSTRPPNLGGVFTARLLGLGAEATRQPWAHGPAHPAALPSESVMTALINPSTLTDAEPRLGAVPFLDERRRSARRRPAWRRRPKARPPSPWWCRR